MTFGIKEDTKVICIHSIVGISASFLLYFFPNNTT